MKNKKKTIIISAIGLVLLVAVIVSVVVMKQSGQKAAKEPDKSEQTATDPTSVDDEKAVEDELPVVPIQAEESGSVDAVSGDSAIGNSGKQDSPSTSGTNGKQDSPSTSGTNGKQDSPSTSGTNGKQNGQSLSGSGGKKTDETSTTTENATTEKTTTESTTTEQNMTEQPTTKPDDSGAIELPFVPAE